MGYHEKAFDLFLPYSTDGSEIRIRSEKKDDYIYVNRLKSYADVIPIRSGDEIFWVGLIIIFFKNIVLF